MEGLEEYYLRRPSRQRAALLAMVAMGMMSGARIDGEPVEPEPFPGIDPEKEYELILAKKSRLAASMRQQIVDYIQNKRR